MIRRLREPAGEVQSVLSVGAWRSLVAHLHGVQGVGGSNPLAPTILTIEKQEETKAAQAAFFFWDRRAREPPLIHLPRIRQVSRQDRSAPSLTSVPMSGPVAVVVVVAEQVANDEAEQYQRGDVK